MGILEMKFKVNCYASQPSPTEGFTTYYFRASTDPIYWDATPIFILNTTIRGSGHYEVGKDYELVMTSV
jgi:hypothetical protein